MENQGQRIQVNTQNVYRPESHSSHHTPNRITKIPRTTLRLQAKLERTYYPEQKTNRLKSKRGKLVNREEIPKLLVYKAIINKYGAMELNCGVVPASPT